MLSNYLTMKIIGITGGIGSGKSTVAKVFVSMGYPVYNSDLMAKQLINSDSVLIGDIKSHFGQEIYSGNKLDRKKMAGIVFNDPEKLKILNSLVHPAVGRDFESWKKEQSTSIVLKEAAIIFETGIHKSLDATLLVTTPESIRIKRVMKRDNTTKEQVIERMNNQWSDDKKAELADYIIDNSGDKMVIPQVQEIISSIMSGA